MNLEFNYFLFSYGTTITAFKRVLFKIFMVRYHAIYIACTEYLQTKKWRWSDSSYLRFKKFTPSVEKCP